MAIGNYWECVLPEGANTPPLQRILDESTMLAQQYFSSWCGPDGADVGGADFACLGFGAGEMRAIVHLVKPRGRPNFYLHSAFPWLAAGPPFPLTLYEINTDHVGLEGFLNVGVHDRLTVTFFDPLFAINRAKYKPGVEYRFTLSAVSLDLKPATPEPARIASEETMAQMREAERAATSTVASSLDYIQVDTSQAKILVRAAENASDYYIFQGPVRGIRSATFLDRPFLIFRTAVMDLYGDDLAVDIYVDRARFRSRPIPTAGHMASGTLWLQGCLAEAGA